MLTFEQKQQFLVYVFDKNLNMGPSSKAALSQFGFDAHYFNDAAALRSQSESQPPHVLVFAVHSIDGPLNEFVNFFNQLSNEILFVVLANPEMFANLREYEPLGLYQLLSPEGKAIEDRVVMSVNAACERLFLMYQNEQLFSDLKELKNQKLEVGEAHGSLQHHSAIYKDVPARIKNYQSASSLEELIQKFLDHFPERKVVFFKYIEGVRTLVATHGKGMQVSQLSGLGDQIELAEVKTFQERLLLGLPTTKILSDVVDVFQSPNLRAFPVYVLERLEGFFVSTDEHLEDFETELSLFGILFSHLSLEKKLDVLEIRDQLTGLKNSKSYQERVSAEINRASRVQSVFSIVKTGLDNLDQMTKDHGEVVRDEAIKLVGAYLSKLSRFSDEVFRIGINDFALFLPDTSKEQAAVMCERIRRYVLSHSQQDKGVSTSMSFGITEYPRLGATVEALDATASRALKHIQEQGGNKICMYKLPNHSGGSEKK